jgi:hypothetical protein
MAQELEGPVTIAQTFGIPGTSGVTPEGVHFGGGGAVRSKTVLKCSPTDEDTLCVTHLLAEEDVKAKNVHVTEDITLSNSDCAEEFDLEDSSTGEPLPGSVMVIGDEGSVRLSTSAYDKRVAGVISGAGAFKPGITLGRQSSDRRRPAIALMGKVFCKVDTVNGPIRVGNLLTTSGTPGHAMKATDPLRAFGAVIGKALGGLERGRGMVPILVVLQWWVTRARRKVSQSTVGRRNNTMADISMRQMAQTLATLDERTAKMDHKLDGIFDRFDGVEGRLNSLFSFTARATDGRSLITVVQTIEHKIEHLDDSFHDVLQRIFDWFDSVEDIVKDD